MLGARSFGAGTEIRESSQRKVEMRKKKEEIRIVRHRFMSQADAAITPRTCETMSAEVRTE